MTHPRTIYKKDVNTLVPSGKSSSPPDDLSSYLFREADFSKPVSQGELCEAAAWDPVS